MATYSIYTLAGPFLARTLKLFAAIAAIFSILIASSSVVQIITQRTSPLTRYADTILGENGRVRPAREATSDVSDRRIRPWSEHGAPVSVETPMSAAVESRVWQPSNGYASEGAKKECGGGGKVSAKDSAPPTPDGLHRREASVDDSYGTKLDRKKSKSSAVSKAALCGHGKGVRLQNALTGQCMTVMEKGQLWAGDCKSDNALRACLDSESHALRTAGGECFAQVMKARGLIHIVVERCSKKSKLNDWSFGGLEGMQLVGRDHLCLDVQHNKEDRPIIPWPCKGESDYKPGNQMWLLK